MLKNWSLLETSELALVGVELTAAWKRNGKLIMDQVKGARDTSRGLRKADQGVVVQVFAMTNSMCFNLGSLCDLLDPLRRLLHLLRDLVFKLFKHCTGRNRRIYMEKLYIWRVRTASDAKKSGTLFWDQLSPDWAIPIQLSKIRLKSFAIWWINLLIRSLRAWKHDKAIGTS